MVGKWIAVVALLTLISTATASGSSAGAESPDSYPVSPVLKADGTKWRFGYLQGGAYYNYRMYLAALVKAFQELEWIRPGELPSAGKAAGAKDLWKWLAEGGLESRYIAFVADTFWSAEWDEHKRKVVQKKVLRRLNRGGDIDVMLALGTWAGQDLANNHHSTRTFVLSCSDSVRAGIARCAEYSGYDHVHTRVVKGRYKLHIRLFHDIVGFEKLGIAYENSPAGRTYAGVEEIEEVAAERGFEILTCETLDHTDEPGLAYRSVRKCYRELAERVDAVYVTQQTGVSLATLPGLLEPLFEAGVPTFSQAGSEEVKHGVLLSLARAEFYPDAMFHAKAIARSLNGVQPGRLNQVFEAPPKIAVNLETAAKIQFDPPVEILGAADEIYERIETLH